MLIPNLGLGGAQRVFHDQSRFLVGHFQVTEAVFNLDDGHTYPSGNPVVDLGVPGGGGPLAKATNFAARVRRFTGLKRKVRPAVTLSHLEGADYVNVLSRGGDRTILCVHGSKLHDANIRGPLGVLRKRLLIPRLYNRADAIVTVSRDIAIELEAMGVDPGRMRTIHNFFDPSAIRARSLEPLTAAEQAIFDGPPVFVTSGRLAFGKNQAPLIAAFADLVRRRPARLLLLGDGEVREALVQQARDLGLSVFDATPGKAPAGTEDVLFLGYQANPFRLQRHASLFILSSAWEGFPMVLGEAMACGLPIVSADCPTGPREFLAPGTLSRPRHPILEAERGEFGVLLPVPDRADPASLEIWVGALDRLLGDRAERDSLSQASLARVEDFTVERIGPQWLALIAELISRP